MNEETPAEQRLRLLIALVQVGAVAWVMTPPHARKLILMRLAEASRQLLGRLARQSGHAFMATELRTGRQEYRLPMALSMMRDRAARLYDKAREVS